MKVLCGLLSVIIDDETADRITEADAEEARDVVIAALQEGHHPKLLAARSLVAEGTDLIGEEVLEQTRQEIDGTLIGVITTDLLRYTLPGLMDPDDSDLH